MKDRRQVRDRVAEDENGLLFGRPSNVPDEAADGGVGEREILAFGVEAAEQVARPRRVTQRLVLGADPLAPARGEAGRQQRGSRATQGQGE